MRHKALAATFLLLAAATFARGEESVETAPVVRKAVHDGVAVKMTIDHAAAAEAQPLRGGDDVVVRFEITDAATGAPLRGAKPAAWMDGGHDRPSGCRDRINIYAGGGFLGRADVNLNTFHVLAMNDDATLTVVDPLFGFGGTKLLALVELPSPANDWVLTDDSNQLFVSMAKAKQVALVDTAAWRVAKSVSFRTSPGRIVLQRDEGYLWVATEDALVALRTKDLGIAASLPLPSGAHDVVVSHDNRFVFATSAEGDRVTVVDVAKLAVVREVKVARPVSIAWSSLANTAYVASEKGAIVAVGTRGVLATIDVGAGVSMVRVTPDARLALAINPLESSIDVIDVSTNRLMQSGELPGVPDQIAFSRTIAYVLLRDSEQVQMIVLSELGHKDAPIAIADVGGGRRAFETDATSFAPSVVQAVGGDSVLFANGPDRVIYYYQEGMAAPMGNFNNYGRRPRAVMVVDRSLRERRPGVYETSARLADAGRYDVAFLLDVPRAVDCFNVAVAEAPRTKSTRPVVHAALVDDGARRSGAKSSLRFRLTNEAGAPIETLGDSLVLIFAPGIWQGREQPRPLGDGTFAVDFTPPAPGNYAMYLNAASQGLSYTFVGSVSVQ
ncbi:MAG TPA: YncE family protein [Thermoanaerobaculia bacterium]|nr:YncE family protein [Thermoanaerobaculia bacterium]